MKKKTQPSPCSGSIYEEIFNASNDVILIQEARSGKIIDVNKSMLNMFGYTRDEVINGQIDLISANTTPFTKEEADNYVSKCISDGPQHFEWLCKDKYESVFWVEVSLQHIPMEPTGRIIAIIRNTDKQKKTEAALKESERLYKNLIDTVPDTILVCNLDRVITFASLTSSELLGYENITEILNRDIFEFIDPEDLEYASIMFHDVIRYGFVSNIETKIIKKNGETVVVEAQAATIQAKDHASKEIIISIRDITERKHFEQALLRETIFSDTVINSLPGLFYVFDNEFRFIRWNKNVELISGYQPQEIKQMEPADFFAHNDSSDVINTIKSAREKGEAIVEATLMTKDKRPLQYLFTAMRMEIEDQCYLIGMALNIDKQKRTEIQLRNSEQKYRQIFENIRDIYYEATLDGTIIEITPSVEIISKYKREELIGHSLDDIYLEPNDRDKTFKAILSHKKITDAEILVKDKTNQVHTCSINAELVTNEAGEPVKIAGSIRDITESKQLKEQLQHAQKMEAIGTLAGGIAHDFNNLLTAIIGGADLALANITNVEEIRQIMYDIRDSGIRASNLIKQLLAFSRKQVLKKDIIDINKLLLDLRKLLNRLIREDIVLDIDLSKSNPVIQADANQVEQVMINLVINATDAMPIGGALLIKTKQCSITSKDIIQNIHINPGKYVKITVEDTGIGMDEETIQKIFDPFFTTKEIGKGTGLGLAMVYGIIKQHNGYVFVHSTPGKGTTFSIYLPMAHKELAEKKTLSTETKKDRPALETILVVEDEEMVQKLVCNTLSKAGYKVIKSENVFDAIQIAEKNKNDLDMMITDIIMPDMNGQDLQLQVKGFCPDIKTIYMSGHSYDILFENDIPKDNFNFIQKPFRMNDLLIMVQEVLDRK